MGVEVLVAALPSIIGAGAAGVGAYSSLQGMKDAKKKAASPPPLPATPDSQDAAQSAAETLKKRRRISLLSGGDTNVTRGTGAITPANLGQKTLLGA